MVIELAPAPQPVRQAPSPRDTLPRDDPIVQLPIVILFPHSRCNCRCVMCDIWRATTRDEIEPEAVAGWLAGWRDLGVARVVLSGGEPLMHSSLWTLCELLHAEGIGITLLSTGILLKRHAQRLARYCDEVIVSLDGPREVHNGIRSVRRAYEKLAEGVAAIKTAAPSLSVSGRCTVQRQNHRSLRATVAAARELGLDRISFLAADVSTDAFNRPEGWDEDRVRAVALAPSELGELADELDALEREHAADFASGYIAESPDKLRRCLQQYYTALLGRDDFAPVSCNAPWVSTVIETDGTVRPCFFQPPLGNIYRTGDLGAILNSEEARRWRRGLDMGRDAICRKCVCSLQYRAAATTEEKP